MPSNAPPPKLFDFAGAFSYTVATIENATPYRRDGRVDDCGGLENRCGCITHRGFESLSLRRPGVPGGDARVVDRSRLLSG